MDWDTVIVAFILTALANLIEIPLFWWFSRPDRLLRRLSDPSDVDRATLGAFFNVMLDLFVTPSVKTGRKVKVEVSPEVLGEDGKIKKEAVFRMQDEVSSPLDLLVERMGTDVLQRFQGWTGALKRDMGKLQKGGGNWDYIIQGLAERIIPKVDQLIEQRLNTKQPPI